MRLIIFCHATSVARSVLIVALQRVDLVLAVDDRRQRSPSSARSPDACSCTAVRFDFALETLCCDMNVRPPSSTTNAATGRDGTRRDLRPPRRDRPTAGVARQQVDDGADAGAAEREPDRRGKVRIEARELLVGEADVAERDELALDGPARPAHRRAPTAARSSPGSWAPPPVTTMRSSGDEPGWLR